ncbi:unnamed protein product [Musa textilis]
MIQIWAPNLNPLGVYKYLSQPWLEDTSIYTLKAEKLCSNLSRNPSFSFLLHLIQKKGESACKGCLLGPSKGESAVKGNWSSSVGRKTPSRKPVASREEESRVDVGRMTEPL